MKQVHTLITVEEIIKDLSQEFKLAQGRELFVAYFMDLYSDLPHELLGLTGDLQEYLHTIFSYTEQAFKCDLGLRLFCVYIDDRVAGFMSCSMLEDNETVLIRTLPVHLYYKHKQPDIWSACIAYIKMTYPVAAQLAIMIRVPNKVQLILCLEQGFRLCNELFQQSEYIAKTYSPDTYNGYRLT